VKNVVLTLCEVDNTVIVKKAAQAALYFVGLMALVVGVLSLYTVFGDSIGIRTANLVSYMAVVLWFVFIGSRWLGGGYSLRMKKVQHVLPRLLVIHCAFLLLVFAVQTLAFILRRRLPGYWLVDRGTDPSLFVAVLMLLFLCIGTAQIYLSRKILKDGLEAEEPSPSPMPPFA